MAFFMLQAQNQTFVYAINGEKILLEQNDNIKYVHFVPNSDAKSIESAVNELSAFTSQVVMITPEIYRCDLSGKSVANFNNKIENLDIVSSYSSEYRLPNSQTKRWVANNLYVRMKENMAIEDALRLSNVSYLMAEPVIADIFRIQVESEDVFTACQHIFETGTVEYAEPSFYYLFPAEETLPESKQPDRGYSNWNLKGIENGNYGINAINAWNITTGNPNIKVAIVDDGVLR